MRYSLADYIVTITPPDGTNDVFSEIKIGGDGTYLGSINVDYQNSLYDIQSFPTGAYVYNKNLARNGTVSLALTQLCKEVALLKQMTNVLFDKDYAGFTISVHQRGKEEAAAKCTDCFPVKIPTQVMEATAQQQTWQFLAGKITTN